MDVDVSSFGNSMKLVIIYRPPTSKKNKHSFGDFLVEFTGFIEHYALMTTRFAVVGDFNIYWDMPSDNNVKRIADLLERLNIIQHVHAPTHIDDHTIDLILTPSVNLRSHLGGMSRRHGETGRSAENYHVPKVKSQRQTCVL